MIPPLYKPQWNVISHKKKSSSHKLQTVHIRRRESNQKREKKGRLNNEECKRKEKREINRSGSVGVNWTLR
jgi:hypothetical protein